MSQNEHYADPLDRAVVEQERLLEEQLRVAKSTITPQKPYRGTCYNCDELLTPPNRYCDSDCRDDHEKRTQRAGINGIRL